MHARAKMNSTSVMPPFPVIPTTAPVTPATAPVMLTAELLKKETIPLLEERLRKLNRPVTGRKADLIERIISGSSNKVS